MVGNTLSSKATRLGYISYNLDDKMVKLTNYNTTLAPRNFIGGHTGSEKIGEKVAKGKFGDGLQSACVVFTSRNLAINIHTASPG